jgi:predicted transcriptional regulator
MLRGPSLGPDAALEPLKAGSGRGLGSLIGGLKEGGVGDPCISEILLIIPRDRRGIVRIKRINLVGRFIASTSSPLRSSFVDGSELDLTAFTAEIVSAYVVNNTLARDQLPAMISSVCAALNAAVAQTGEPLKEVLKPAVPVKKSVTADYIVCLEDGKRFKSLKRHLRSHYDMSPEQYRERWGLARDYPMVAPAYAAARSQLAKSIGLGQSRRKKVAESSAPPSKSEKGGKRTRAAGR